MACGVGLVVSMSVSHTVDREFAYMALAAEKHLNGINQTKRWLL